MKSKTEITPERLMSIGFEMTKPCIYYCYEIDIETFLSVYLDEKNNVMDVFLGDHDTDKIEVNRRFSSIEDIKELLTGLTGKKDFRI